VYQNLSEERIRLELVVVPQRDLKYLVFRSRHQGVLRQSSIVEALVPEGHRRLREDVRLTARFLTEIHGDRTLVGAAVWEETRGKDGGLRVGQEVRV
ncbi:hypothetical protein PENTCL1PPCAC_25046, partial [Pristionchus entomophagus]